MTQNEQIVKALESYPPLRPGEVAVPIDPENDPIPEHYYAGGKEPQNSIDDETVLMLFETTWFDFKTNTVKVYYGESGGKPIWHEDENAERLIIDFDTKDVVGKIVKTKEGDPFAHIQPAKLSFRELLARARKTQKD
jgi:hypothetical protein